MALDRDEKRNTRNAPDPCVKNKVGQARAKNCAWGPFEIPVLTESAVHRLKLGNNEEPIRE